MSMKTNNTQAYAQIPIVMETMRLRTFKSFTLKLERNLETAH